MFERRSDSGRILRTNVPRTLYCQSARMAQDPGQEQRGIYHVELATQG
jgi:hypothetical protein